MTNVRTKVGRDAPDVYVLRLSGELGIKSAQTRKSFTNQLVSNIEDALTRLDIDYELQQHWERVDVRTPDVRAEEVLSRIPGIQAVCPAVAYEWQGLDDLVERGRTLFSDMVAGEVFRVSARRVGQREGIPFTSMDVANELGRVLVEAGGDVDLEDPEVVAGVEVRRDECFFFRGERAGPAGLPVGSEGRALSLMSGGFDSAVATWTMLKRGVATDFVFFNLAGSAHEKGVRSVTKQLADRWCYGYEPTLHVVDFRPVVVEMKDRVPGRYWQLLLKRLMMRAAEVVAEQEDYPALITGESVGQVSSQTLHNLAAITTPIRVPIMRPLSGLNKNEITDIADDIETYEASAEVPEFCALDGGPPVTKSSTERLDKHEESINTDLVELMARQRRSLDVLQMDSWEDIDIEIEYVPEDAAVFDIRPQVDDDQWAHPDAIHLRFEKAIENYPRLPRDRSYLFYCSVGLKSALLAERMKEAGFEAYSFAGGVPNLREYLNR